MNYPRYRKIHISSKDEDFSCRLICQRSWNCWIFTIDNIIGNKKHEILGTITSVPLNVLIIEDMRDAVIKELTNICKFSNILISSYNIRVILRSLFNGCLYGTELQLQSIKTNFCTKRFFMKLNKIRMISETVRDINSRIMFQSILSITDELKKAQNDEERENFVSILNLIASEGISLCTDIKTNIKIQKDEPIYMKLPKFIHRIKFIADANVTCTCDSNFVCSKQDFSSIQLMINCIIHSCIPINILDVNIHISNFENKIYFIFIFFGQFDSLEKLDCLGEDFLKISQEWKTKGNSISTRKTLTNDLKVEFQCEGNISDFSLTVYDLSILKFSNAKKIILIVDDSLVSLKMLFHSILKYFKYQSNFLSLDFSTSNYIVFDSQFEDYILIFSMSSIYAKHIYTVVNCYCVITDINMPNIDGYELIEFFRELNYRQKIFINSGLSQKTIFDRLANIQDLFFLSKGTIETNLECIFT